jgi:hypothetical protein
LLDFLKGAKVRALIKESDTKGLRIGPIRWKNVHKARINFLFLEGKGQANK